MASSILVKWFWSERCKSVVAGKSYMQGRISKGSMLWRKKGLHIRVCAGPKVCGGIGVGQGK